PYTDHALREKALSYDLSDRRVEARNVYEELLKLKPRSPYRTEALRYIMDVERERNDLAAAEKWAREWRASAPIQEAFLADMEIAQILRARGDAAGAKAAAARALHSIEAFRDALWQRRLPGTGPQQMKWDRDSRESEAKARSF